MAGSFVGKAVEVMELLKGLEPWQLVLGFLTTGAAGGYFTRQLAERLLNPEYGELRRKLTDTETNLTAVSNQLQTTQKERKEYRNRLTKYEAVREALLSEEGQLWRLHPQIPPEGYLDKLSASRTKIVMIGNHKGGVGKTTLAVNLAAYFEKRLSKRVLIVDLDYQGSLSTMILKAVGLAHSGSLANDVLSGKAAGGELLKLARPLQPKLPRSSVIPANYEFYALENRLMLRWLLEEIDTDIRYHLASALLTKGVQENFDVVILDTPPRLTTAAINALCACHYLIVPTVPDGLSAISVGRFLQQICALKGSLFPLLSVAGVVVNLSRVNALGDDERDSIASIKRDLAELGIAPHVFERNIPRMVALSGAAGEEIAYLNDKLFREGIMDRLGDEIAQRIGVGGAT